MREILMAELTLRQEQVLKFIQAEIAKGKPFPSHSEIAKQFGIQHKSGVTGHIRSLERKGYIQKSRARVSDFSLTQALGPAETGCFKLVGTIPAGTPKASYDQFDESIAFTPSYFASGELSAVKITGDSMSGDAICDGDIAIIKHQNEAFAQDIVAVRVGQEEVTLKRVRLCRQFVELVPSNKAYEVRRVSAEQVEIVGKLVGVVRRM